KSAREILEETSGPLVLLHIKRGDAHVEGPDRLRRRRREPGGRRVTILGRAHGRAAGEHPCRHRKEGDRHERDHNGELISLHGPARVCASGRWSTTASASWWPRASDGDGFLCAAGRARMRRTKTKTQSPPKRTNGNP